MDTSRTDGRIRRKARFNLLYALNCAQATLLTLGSASGRSDPTLMRAATNFEGGCVGCGSSCGVVSGGVLGMGALLSSIPGQEAQLLEQDIYEASIAYRKWFEERFGTSICRERIETELGTLGGFLSYLFPGDKLVRCLQHIGEALVFVNDGIRRAAEKRNLPLRFEKPLGGGPREPHCAYTVFKALASRSGRQENAVGWACTGLGGGVALGGAVCGGLLGAILGLGLRYGVDPEAMGYGGILKEFIVGHRNLVRHEKLSAAPVDELPKEAFARSRYLADGFEQAFGSLNCREITGRDFSSPDELGAFLPDSKVCGEIFAWCEQEATKLIAA